MTGAKSGVPRRPDEGNDGPIAGVRPGHDQRDLPGAPAPATASPATTRAVTCRVPARRPGEPRRVRRRRQTAIDTMTATTITASRSATLPEAPAVISVPHVWPGFSARPALPQAEAAPLGSPLAGADFDPGILKPSAAALRDDLRIRFLYGRGLDALPTAEAGAAPGEGPALAASGLSAAGVRPAWRPPPRAASRSRRREHDR